MDTEPLQKWEREKLEALGLDDAIAFFGQLPSFSGDGYGYGGGAVVHIGKFIIEIGEGEHASALAKEIVNRWNEVLETQA